MAAGFLTICTAIMHLSKGHASLNHGHLEGMYECSSLNYSSHQLNCEKLYHCIFTMTSVVAIYNDMQSGDCFLNAPYVMIVWHASRMLSDQVIYTIELIKMTPKHRQNQQPR
jgi:hypothetical protein